MLTFLKRQLTTSLSSRSSEALPPASTTRRPRCGLLTSTTMTCCCRSPEVWLQAGVSGNSRSRPFPRMEASDSLSRIMGMDFFIPFPFPNFGNAFFSFPSRSRIMGMVFFHSLPVPELWEWIFFIPFPFPNLLFHRRESKRELDYCKRYQASNFFSFLYISQNNYINEVN